MKRAIPALVAVVFFAGGCKESDGTGKAASGQSPSAVGNSSSLPHSTDPKGDLERPAGRSTQASAFSSLLKSWEAKKKALLVRASEAPEETAGKALELLDQLSPEDDNRSFLLSLILKDLPKGKVYAAIYKSKSASLEDKRLICNMVTEYIRDSQERWIFAETVSPGSERVNLLRNLTIQDFSQSGDATEAIGKLRSMEYPEEFQTTLVDLMTITEFRNSIGEHEQKQLLEIASSHGESVAVTVKAQFANLH